MKYRILLVFIAATTMFLLSCQKPENYPQSLLIYPGAFTPNDDGLNDYWGPEGGLKPDVDSSVAWISGINLDTYELRIRNKNGRPLFYSEDINTPWDGTYRGDTCADSFYYYLVMYESLEGVKYRDEGVFELIR